MFRIFANRCERNLVRAKSAFNRNSVHFFGTGPSLGCAQDDHRPDRLLFEAVLPLLLLDGSNLLVASVQGSSQELVHRLRIVAFDKIWLLNASRIQHFSAFLSCPALPR